MKLTEAQIQLMKEDIYVELVQLLMSNWGYTMPQAMDTLYNSDTFSRIEDARTGLYFQSPGYIYSYLDTELRTGAMA